MSTPAAPVQVVVLGGSVAEGVTRVVGELSHLPNVAILASCPGLDVDTVKAASGLPIVELVDRSPLEAHHVYVLPAERHVAVENGELVVGEAGRAAFDGVMRSVAAGFGRDAIGIVLAGTGTDGSLGIQRLKEEGGLTIAQVEHGPDGERPAAAIETGFVDLVLPIDAIASRVRAVATLDPARDEQLEAEAAAATLREILALVRGRSGHDFSGYKRATLFRRIARRIQVCECTDLDGYLRHLRQHPDELGHLLRDFLIGVTSFFRDPEVFAAIKRDLVPKLFARKGPEDQLRLWIAGCATGQEAYSFGMLLLEHASTLNAPPTLQIFATDIDDRSLAEARLGLYSEAIATDVSAERLIRFFTRENGRYRVTKELREMVLFTPHNVLRDPPFSRLDLVSCRNLMIYLDRGAQQRALSMFHFGLRHDGVLVLGASESAEGSTTFAPSDPMQRTFARKVAPVAVGAPVAMPARWQPPLFPLVGYAARDRAVSLGELHFRLIEHYAPPSALVDAELDIVHLSEHAGRYFTIAGGELTRQVLRLAHPALRLELRNAIYSARQTGHEIRNVRYPDPTGAKTVQLRVRTVELPELAHGAVLITFEDRLDLEATQVTPPISTSLDPVVREIEDELYRTRDQLRLTIEQYETSVEELKASNEELESINEEMRAATEELETGKEELQAVNEELTTVNDELKFKVDEIIRANSNLQNLMSSTEIGVVFLDRSLRITRFTPKLGGLFNIIAADLGRPLAHLTHRLVIDDLVETAQTVLDTLRTVERKVATRDGRSFLVRWLPYRAVDDRVDGVVVTFVDLTNLRDAVEARRKSEHALLEVEERLGVALRSAPLAVLIFGRDQSLSWAYMMGDEVGDPRAEPLSIFEPEDARRLLALVRVAAEQGIAARAELRVTIAGTARTFDFRIDPSASGVTAVGFDITIGKLAQANLLDADRRKDEFLATLSHELRNPLAPLKIALEVARLVDADPDKRAATRAVMERQVTMLSELVDELLDLSRITQGKAQLDRVIVDIKHVLERALEATAPAIARGEHQLEVELPPGAVCVVGDVRRLVQVFTNLLINAAKYTPPRGRIAVSSTVDPDRRRLAVHVADNGVGISPATLQHMFEIFVQSRDDEGRSQGGLGIGLNVVRRLVELHGGNVTAASDGVGRGSVFTVELPLSAE